VHELAVNLQFIARLIVMDIVSTHLKVTIDVLAKLLLVDGDWSGDGEPKV